MLTFYRAIQKLENLKENGFGVKDESEIPYEPMIPVLASLLKLLETQENKAACFDKIKMWYWASIFSNAYSSSVDTQMTADYKGMVEWFSNDSSAPKTVDQMRKEFSLLNLWEIRTKSNAIYKGVMSLIAIAGAKDFETAQTLENARLNDKDHIFPVGEYGEERYVHSVLNMTWMSTETNRGFKRCRKPSAYLRELVQQKFSGNENRVIETLKTHLIDQSGYDHLKEDRFEDFLKERERAILAVIRGCIGISEDNAVKSLISPETPFTNKIIFFNTIKSCHDYIYYIDKYFTLIGLQWLAECVDKSRVREVRIITSSDKVDDKIRSLFKDFAEEMKNSGVLCRLRVITNPKLKSQIHDRWIISKNVSYNIPSPDVIARGQYSEIRPTDNQPPFQQWWDESLDIVADWNKIRQAVEGNQQGKPS